MKKIGIIKEKNGRGEVIREVNVFANRWTKGRHDRIYVSVQVGIRKHLDDVGYFDLTKKETPFVATKKKTKHYVDKIVEMKNQIKKEMHVKEMHVQRVRGFDPENPRTWEELVKAELGFKN